MVEPPPGNLRACSRPGQTAHRRWPPPVIGHQMEFVAHVPGIAVDNHDQGLAELLGLANGSSMPSLTSNGLPLLARGAKASTSMPREKFSPWPKNTAARRLGSLSKS